MKWLNEIKREDDEVWSNVPLRRSVLADPRSDLAAKVMACFSVSVLKMLIKRKDSKIRDEQYGLSLVQLLSDLPHSSSKNTSYDIPAAITRASPAMKPTAVSPVARVKRTSVSSVAEVKHTSVSPIADVKRTSSSPVADVKHTSVSPVARMKRASVSPATKKHAAVFQVATVKATATVSPVTAVKTTAAVSPVSVGKANTTSSLSSIKATDAAPAAVKVADVAPVALTTVDVNTTSFRASLSLPSPETRCTSPATPKSLSEEVYCAVSNIACFPRVKSNSNAEKLSQFNFTSKSDKIILEILQRKHKPTPLAFLPALKFCPSDFYNAEDEKPNTTSFEDAVPDTRVSRGKKRSRSRKDDDQSPTPKHIKQTQDPNSVMAFDSPFTFRSFGSIQDIDNELPPWRHLYGEMYDIDLYTPRRHQ